MKKNWINRKVYNIRYEDLLSCCDNDNTVDIEKMLIKTNAPIHRIKAMCRIFKLKFKNTGGEMEVIQCPVCEWSGGFKFSTHLLNPKELQQQHESWIKKNLIDRYNELKSYNKVAQFEEIKKHNISPTIIKNILSKLKILKKNKIVKHKCPVCNWYDRFGFIEHVEESNDDKHNTFKQDLIKKYNEEKMSYDMIANYYKISSTLMKHLLLDLGVKFRSHHEAVINAVQQGRQNINAYGISGFRKDLNDSFRSIPEANFARILKYKNIKFEKEKCFDLFDENGKWITSYFMDFYFNENDEKGVEMKGFGNDYEFKNKEKIILFTKQYPNIKLKVIYASSDEWKVIEKEYSKLIPLWETQKQNIEKTPELYK